MSESWRMKPAWSVVASLVMAVALPARADERDLCLTAWQTDDHLAPVRYETCRGWQAMVLAPAPRPPVENHQECTQLKSAPFRPSHDSAAELLSRPFDAADLRAGTAALISAELHADPQAVRDEHAFDDLCRFSYPSANKEACADSFAAFKADLAATGDPDGSVRAAALRKMLESNGRGCLGEPKLSFEHEEWIYLTLAGYKGDRITVYQARPGTALGAPNRVLRVGRPLVVDGNRQIAVTAVPKNVELLIRIENDQRRHLTPWVFFGLEPDQTGQDHFLDTTQETRGACLKLAVDLPEGGHVLLDGYPLHVSPKRTLTAKTRVQRDDHTVTILVPDQATPNALKVWKSEVFDARDLKQCHEISYDATRKTKKIVGIQRVDVGSECVHAGVNEAQLRGRVESFLKANASADLEVRDFSRVLTMANELGTSRAELEDHDGPRRGRSRGNADSTSNLRDLAREMLRQGFDVSVSLSLHCSRNGHGWDYSANAVSMNSSYESEQPVPVSRTQLMTDPQELYEGVVAPLARLLEIPYAHFIAPYEPVNFVGTIPVALEVYTGKHAPKSDTEKNPLPVKVRVQRLDDDEARVCATIAAGNQLRSPHVHVSGMNDTQEWSETLVEDVTLSADTVIRRIELEGDPSFSGTYVVEVSYGEARSKEPKRRAATSYRCLEVVDDESELFVSLLTLLWEPINRTDTLRPEEYDHNMLLVGIGFRKGISGVLGFAIADRRAFTPPAWDGLTTDLQIDNRGLTEYTIVERSLLGGLAFTFQDQIVCRIGSAFWSGCGSAARRMGLLARIMPLVNIAVLDVGNVDAGIFPSDRAGRAARGGINVDLTTVAQLGLHVRLGDDAHTIRLLSHLVVPKLFDLFLLGEAEQRAEPNFDGRLLFGLGIEYARSL